MKNYYYQGRLTKNNIQAFKITKEQLLQIKLEKGQNGFLTQIIKYPLIILKTN